MPPEIVDALLRIESLGIVRQVDWFPELPSTNDYALELADLSEGEFPRLVWTGRQTAGRGRGANVWWSAPGSLTFSLVVDGAALGVESHRRPQLALVTGLAVLEALALFVPEMSLGLKWPNDVWLAGRKVAGILVETSSRCPERLVIGVGVNVSNSFRSAPAEICHAATSIVDESAEGATAPAVLLAFLSAWFRLVRDFADQELLLAERWRRHCVLAGRPVRLTAGSVVVDGGCVGIDDGGALLIETTRGRERHIAGTVRRMSD